MSDVSVVFVTFRLVYRLAIRAAPPSSAPMPMAAVWSGPALSVALVWAELAALCTELTLEAPALLRLAILEEMEAEAAEPVAVARSEDREAMPEPILEVMEAMLELAAPSMEETRLDAWEAMLEASLSIEETPLAMAPVPVAETTGTVKS